MIGSSDKPVFSYEEAFSRNLGFVTEWEQQVLRTKRVAIAGTGGVGGGYVLTLARFGIGCFNIADLDHFELANFNRQAGASMESLGRPKVEVIAEKALQINPELKINCFKQGVTEANLDAFLTDVDVYVDGLDFYVLQIRRKLFARCAELGIPTIIAAPFGLGTAFLVFQPNGMSFEQWFQLEGLPEVEQYINWYVGLAPGRLQTRSLIDPSHFDILARRGPSTIAGCELCAGVASVAAVKLLLGRGQVRAVPYYQQFDAYQGRFVVKKLRRGNRALGQKLKITLARHFLAKLQRASVPVNSMAPASIPASTIEKILYLARWAPSVDNVQPWRFEIVSDFRIIIHIEGSGDVYDFNDGELTLLSAGCLLENLRIAASGQGKKTTWSYLGNTGRSHRIGVDLETDPAFASDRLLPFLALRSVDRSAYRLQPLSARQKNALEHSLGDEFSVEWHETLADRWRESRFNAEATDMRLRIREAYEVHRRVIDWAHEFSETGLPSTAIGLDRLTLTLMRWFMGDWRRMHFMNCALGTALPQIEMDLLPGVCCAAHFTIRWRSESGKSPQRLVEAGQTVQRFWLTATEQGLALQPTIAPLCFAYYGREKASFTTDRGILVKAARFAARFDSGAREADGEIVFRGRIGYPTSRLKKSRSIRLSSEALIGAGSGAS